jgi:hypothetical protein
MISCGYFLHTYETSVLELLKTDQKLLNEVNINGHRI